jgi:hypothetical protein
VIGPGGPGTMGTMGRSALNIRVLGSLTKGPGEWNCGLLVLWCRVQG